jgi:hypothetical protein
MSDASLISESESEALVSLDSKWRLIDDRVTAVVRGYHTGLYLCGAKGVGKSFNVFRQLQNLECDFRAFNSRMTALGLFRALDKAPDAVHVLEDMERITSDRDAQGVLRSALWSQADRDRVVTWTTNAGEQRVNFRGGIIMLANRPLGDLPELRALASRIAVHKLEVSDAEMCWHMRRIARQGWSRFQHKLEAVHCLEICEHVIAECRRASCPLDLRLLDNACTDYLLWEANYSHLHWKDLVTTRIQQAAAHFGHEVSTLSREERKAGERDLVRDILGKTADPQERERVWEQKTGKRKSPGHFGARRAEEVGSHHWRTTFL